LPASSYLQLLRNYRDEASSVVLNQVFASLKELDNAVVNEASRASFARLVREILGPTARRLGWKAKKGEPEEAKVTRGDMLFALGTLGRDPTVLAEATRRAALWMADPAKTDPETAELALVLAAKRGDAAMYDHLITLLKRPAAPVVHRLARTALRAFHAASMVERTLDLTLDGTLKDPLDLLLGFFRRQETALPAHAWVEKHFDELIKTSANVPYVLAMAPMNLCSAERVRAVEAFLRPRLEKLGRAADLQKWVESGLRCAALAGKETEAMTAWLTGRGHAK
jgi:hypothetical protein